MHVVPLSVLVAYGLLTHKCHGQSPLIAMCSPNADLVYFKALIDPRTRFSEIEPTIPPTTWPVLQSSFGTPPDCGEKSYRGTARLGGRRALVTGGDSGIGRAITIAYAREGADVAINYLPEEEADANALVSMLAKEGLHVVKLPGDLLNETFCGSLVHQANKALSGLDLIVNNAG
jgi:hypothetical protein